MTINSEKVLNFLKEHFGEEFSKKELSEKLGISLPSVVGSINGLQRNEYVTTTREETIEDEPATETRKAKTHVVKYHTLTEKGLTYDPVAEAAEKEAEKQAKKAAKEAERAAKEAAEDNGF